MNAIDSASKWIIKMFKFNARETGGDGCELFEGGIPGRKFGLDTDEVIFGTSRIGRDVFYFGENALLINDSQKRIGWQNVISLNGSFRSGQEKLIIQVDNSASYSIPIAKFPYRLQQLVYQLIEHHSAKNLLPRFLGPKLVRESFETLDKTLSNRVGLELSRFEVAFKIPLGVESGFLFFQGSFDEEEKFIYPMNGIDFVVGWKSKTKWIPLLISDPNRHSDYSPSKMLDGIKTGFRLLPFEVPEIICHYIYSEPEGSSENGNNLRIESGVSDLNEDYSSVVIYFFEGEKLRKLTECEVW